ncbi:winged helix DNA-binding domain-containing protein [Spongiactinospora gelatinilytica]|uniref:winged helix DNA-binding domain-containing protein n=1 Tax=Spongiactinospora gelatinilytica TaxID=2666298 RepID=UPI0011B94859|nr:winged helix DNA-binding domain-containing protein [Spongiactinospora gelatinilytica]
MLTKAACVYGVATTADLIEYFRLPCAAAAQALPHTGLLDATVEGWEQPAWIHPETLNQADTPSTRTSGAWPAAPPVFLTPVRQPVQGHRGTPELRNCPRMKKGSVQLVPLPEVGRSRELLRRERLTAQG